MSNLPATAEEGQGAMTPEETGDAPGSQVTRKRIGRFVKGVSGNPAGRPKGCRNRTTLMRAFIEEALVRDLSGEANAILDKAIQMAKNGDRTVIKLLLGDMMKSARAPAPPEEAEDKGKTTIKVTINNYAGKKEPSPASESPLEGIFSSREDS